MTFFSPVDLNPRGLNPRVAGNPTGRLASNVRNLALLLAAIAAALLEAVPVKRGRKMLAPTVLGALRSIKAVFWT